MERKISKIQFFQMLILLLVTGAVCVLVYKAQIRENLHRPLEYTMMTRSIRTGRNRAFPGNAGNFGGIYLQNSGTEKDKYTRMCREKCRCRRYAFYGSCGRGETGEVYFEEEKPAGEVLNSKIREKSGDGIKKSR